MAHFNQQAGKTSGQSARRAAARDEVMESAAAALGGKLLLGRASSMTQVMEEPYRVCLPGGEVLSRKQAKRRAAALGWKPPTIPDPRKF